MSAVYTPYTNPVSLEAATWNFGDAALASSVGTNAVVSGSDSAAKANEILNTPPETKAKNGATVGSVLDFMLESWASETKKPTDQTAPWYERHSTFVWSVVLIVLALFMFSRGLGMIGEEGVSTIAMIGDPEKYPGIGHAVKSMRK
jgi:hypothetical protein